jgi:rhodanese-related sulfurtransferase
VRNPDETALGVIAGAIVIPLPELERRWVEVKDKNEIVCYCRSGKRSLQAATFLREKGVFNATSLEGGVLAWESFGGKLVPQKA